MRVLVVFCLMSMMLLAVAPTNTVHATPPGTYSLVETWIRPVAYGHQQTPISICAGNGYVYILYHSWSDFGECYKIEQYLADGTDLGEIGQGSAGPGTLYGQFNTPSGIALDTAYNLLYVADTNNNRIQRFSLPDGVWMSQWSTSPGSPKSIAVDSVGNVWVGVDDVLREYNQFGNVVQILPEVTFSAIGGITVGELGKIYVTDMGTNTVTRIDPNSPPVYDTWTSPSSGGVPFSQPRGIAADFEGNIYVADGGNRLIQKINPYGDFYTSWGSDVFLYPTSVAVDKGMGIVYVGDPANYRVLVFQILDYTPSHLTISYPSTYDPGTTLNGVKISGKLLGPGGNPVVGGRVSVLYRYCSDPWETWNAFGTEAWTSSDGSYEVGCQANAVVMNRPGCYLLKAVFAGDDGSHSKCMIVGDTPGMLVASSSIYITIKSNPAGNNFVTVDGSAITTPKTFTWTFGETHTLLANSLISGGGVQYVFTGWSDNGALGHPYIVTSTPDTVTANYVTQLPVSASYSTSDGIPPISSVTLSGVSMGSPSTTILSSLAQELWLDHATAWSVNNPIIAVLGNERWQADSGTSGTISDSITIHPLYYHQFKMTLSYSFTGGGSPSAPSFTAHALGSTQTITLTGTPTDYWFDAGTSWSVTNPLGGSTSTDRWHTSQAVSGSVSAPSTTEFQYSRQFLVSFAVDPNDAGTTSPSVDTWYDAGTTGAVISANPVSGYTFSSWTLNPASALILIDKPDSGHTFMTVNGPGTITANFASDQVSSTVTFTQTGLPPTRTWTATFNGVTKSSTASAISFSNIASGSYSWSVGTPISAGPGVQYSASPPSGSMNVPVQTTQSITFKKQYYLTMNTNMGTVSPSSGWYDAGSKVTIQASAPTPIVGERFVWQYWSGSGFGGYTGSRNPASDAVTMNGPITERAVWAHQYRLTISTLGVPSPYSAGVSINGHTIGHASDASPFTTWITAGGSTGTIRVDARVSDGSNTRYVFTSWSDSSTSNPRPSTQMNAPKTLTASYRTQFRITFSQSGVGYDFSGTVVNVDGSKYSRNSLPTSFWWDKSSVHSFQFISPLGARVWSSTTGLSNLQTGTITVSTSGTVTGIYKK